MSATQLNPIAGLRQEQHLLGRQKMAEGDYLAALEILGKAFARYGSHVLLLGDMIACQILSGRNKEGFQSAQRLEKEIQLAEMLLDEQSLAKARIFLGKLYEEQALLDVACSHYEKSLQAAGPFPELQLRAQAQLLRLSAFREDRKAFDRFYPDCLQSKPETNCLIIELDHALLLGELTFMGPELALQRLDSLLERDDLLPADRRLLVIDFLENLLVQRHEIPSFLKKYEVHIDLQDMDDYEKAVWNLAQAVDGPMLIPDLNRLASQLPLHSLIRLHYLALIQLGGNERIGVRARLESLIFKLPKKSQHVFRKKWSFQDTGNGDPVKIHLSHTEICFQDFKQAVKPNSQLRFVLKKLAVHPQINTDQFIQEIFQCEFDDSSFERARKAIARANELIFKLTGVEKAISISKIKVSLHAVTIHLIDRLAECSTGNQVQHQD